ncbi:hypothetical protein ACFX13_027392 [Malus domestica]
MEVANIWPIWDLKVSGLFLAVGHDPGHRIFERAVEARCGCGWVCCDEAGDNGDHRERSFCGGRCLGQEVPIGYHCCWNR